MPNTNWPQFLQVYIQVWVPVGAAWCTCARKESSPCELQLCIGCIQIGPCRHGHAMHVSQASTQHDAVAQPLTHASSHVTQSRSRHRSAPEQGGPGRASFRLPTRAPITPHLKASCCAPPLHIGPKGTQAFRRPQQASTHQLMQSTRRPVGACQQHYHKPTCNSPLPREGWGLTALGDGTFLTLSTGAHTLKSSTHKHRQNKPCNL